VDNRTLIYLAAFVSTCAIFFTAPAAAVAAPPWLEERTENARGREAYEQGRHDEALRQFEEAGKKAPEKDASIAAFNKGGALFKLGRFREAEQEFGKAASRASGATRADALFNRGLAQEAQQNTQAAIRSYSDALLANPEHKPSRVNLEKLLAAPPPQTQPQAGQSQDQQQGGEDQQAQPPGQGDEDENLAGNQQPDETEPTPDPGRQAGGPEGQSREEQPERKPGASGKLTEKEADDILRAAEQETRGPRLMQQGKPPRDYDPARDW
jgi:tetratricopeptide (TPR) repeat protein